MITFHPNRIDMDPTQLLAFCFSFFLISLSPGLCMTLSLSLGISIGVRRTLWMILGELTGLTLVGLAALGGVGTLMSQSPRAFTAAKLIGAVYLVWSAIRMWKSDTRISTHIGSKAPQVGRLFSSGFITAVSNPKAWIFLAALFPPFINPDNPLTPQATILLCAMVIIEFCCLLIYALGGRVLRGYLTEKGWGQGLNRIASGLMLTIALWLVVG